MRNILFIFFFTGSVASAVSLNDFSILLPLPNEADFPALLKPNDQGTQGSLLPTLVYDRLPQLVPESSNRNTYQNTLRVVGIRIDPCFVEGPSTLPCRRQIRFVWQPVLKIGPSMSTRDAAVHTFYEFDEVTWKAILQTWGTLSVGKPADRLQVHPIIKSETLRGSHWQKLRAVLLKFCGEKNLVRVTAMTIRGNERVWTFSGFDISQKNLLPLLIPRVNTESQLAALDTGRAMQFFGAVQPEPREDTLFFKFIRNSELAKQALTEKDFKGIMAKSFDYENPKVHNTATLDCVSCHMAESARRWGQHSFTTWDWSADFKNRYPNPWFNPSQERAPFNPSLFRAFGYFLNEPVISQRVFNETFEAAKGITGR